MPDQSRESEKQILTVQKDIEHLKYIIDELEKGNSERLDDIKLMHGRIDKHQNADLDFHENVRKKISCRFDILDERIRQLDRWKWATWGALMVVGALVGYFTKIPISFR